MELSQWKQLSSTQRNELRIALRLLMEVDGDTMEVDEEFYDGEMTPDIQDDLDQEHLDFLNERCDANLTELSVMYLSHIIGSAGHDTVDGMQSDMATQVKRWEGIFGNLLESQFIERVQDALRPTIEGLHEQGIEQARLARDTAAIEQSIVRIIIPQLIREQPNLLLRLQADGVSGVTELQPDHFEYQSDNPSHRVMVAEVFNVVAQKQRSAESIIAAYLMTEFSQAYPNPREILDRLKMRPMQPKNLATMVNAAHHTALATDLNQQQVQSPEQVQALSHTPHSERHPATDEFLRKDIDLVTLVSKLQKSRISQQENAGAAFVAVSSQEADSSDQEEDTLMEDMGLTEGDDYDQVQTWENILKGKLISHDTVAAIQTMLDVNLIELGTLNQELLFSIAEHIENRELKDNMEVQPRPPEINVLRLDRGRRR